MEVAVAKVEKHESAQDEQDYVVVDVSDNVVNQVVFTVRANSRDVLISNRTAKEMMAKARKEFGFRSPAEEYQFTGGIDTLDGRFKHRYEKKFVISDAP